MYATHLKHLETPQKWIQRQPWMKIKWKINSNHGVQCPHFQENKKKKSKSKEKKWYQIFFKKLVILDQIDSICTLIGTKTWLSFLSNQFQNAQLDSKSYSLELMFLCWPFYTLMVMHWVSKLKLWLTLTLELETPFLIDWCIITRKLAWFIII